MLQRLALSYAPARYRNVWLGLFALDTRLAGVVRASSEPMLAQLRLAWWREQFRSPLVDAPRGEPLLAVLRGWDAEREALGALVDGWEAMTSPPLLPAQAMQALAGGRGTAVAAIARLAGTPQAAPAAERMAADWALADIASRLGRAEERDAAIGLAKASEWRREALPRALRPLAVLHGLARRAVRQGRALDQLSASSVATALRLGLLGR